MTEYSAVARLFAEACAHIRKPTAREMVVAQLCDFLESNYPEEFEETAWLETLRSFRFPPTEDQ